MERFSREDFESKVDELEERFNSGECFYVYDDIEDLSAIIIPNSLKKEEIESIKSNHLDVDNFVIWENLPGKPAA
jgi:hypothetical protein